MLRVLQSAISRRQMLQHGRQMLPCAFKLHMRGDLTSHVCLLPLRSRRKSVPSLCKEYSTVANAEVNEDKIVDDGYELKFCRGPRELRKILLMSTSINSLTHAVHLHLQETTGYDLDVASVGSSTDIRNEIERSSPDLVICPYLTKKIPSEVYENYPCWIVHPGIVGDRGAHSLDYALLGFEDGKPESKMWGVTVLEASEEYDAGAIWSTEEFPLHASTKSELYHTSVVRAAVNAIDKALECYKNPDFMPINLDQHPNFRGCKQTPLLQKNRCFSWKYDSAKTIAKKINAASGQPGIKMQISGYDYYFYNAFEDSSDVVDQHYTEDERALFRPGQMVMKMNGAILFSTRHPDEFLWVTQMKKKGSFKLPAEQALKKHPTLRFLVENLAEYVMKPTEEVPKAAWRDIHYEIDKSSSVAYLHFEFCNGAMSTDQAIRLKLVYDHLAKERNDVQAIVLMGGRDSFSNGIHLNVIHNTPDPVVEATKNIEAIDDLTKSILNTTDKLVISFIRCGAGAGGVMLSLASDLVWCDSKAVLHPYYHHMGLFGSEYWTYSLPRRVGDEVAKQLTTECKPISAQHAKRIGMIDQLVDYGIPNGTKDIQQMVNALLFNFDWKTFTNKKGENFDSGKAERCRAFELERMYHSFRSKKFQEARASFVH